MKKWLMGILTSVIVIPLFGFWASKFVVIAKAADKIETIEEAYVAQTAYVAEQRTANEINQQQWEFEKQKWEQEKENENRQWQMLVGNK